MRINYINFQDKGFREINTFKGFQEGTNKLLNEFQENANG